MLLGRTRILNVPPITREGVLRGLRRERVKNRKAPTRKMKGTCKCAYLFPIPRYTFPRELISGFLELRDAALTRLWHGEFLPHSLPHRRTLHVITCVCNSKCVTWTLRHSNTGCLQTSPLFFFATEAPAGMSGYVGRLVRQSCLCRGVSRSVMHTISMADLESFIAPLWFKMTY